MRLSIIISTDNLSLHVSRKWTELLKQGIRYFVATSIPVNIWRQCNEC